MTGLIRVLKSLVKIFESNVRVSWMWPDLLSCLASYAIWPLLLVRSSAMYTECSDHLQPQRPFDSSFVVSALRNADILYVSMFILSGVRADVSTSCAVHVGYVRAQRDVCQVRGPRTSPGAGPTDRSGGIWQGGGGQRHRLHGAAETNQSGRQNVTRYVGRYDDVTWTSRRLKSLGHCLFNSLFRLRMRGCKISALLPLREGKPTVTGGFHSQRAQSCENSFHIMMSSFIATF